MPTLRYAGSLTVSRLASATFLNSSAHRRNSAPSHKAVGGDYKCRRPLRGRGLQARSPQAGCRPLLIPDAGHFDVDINAVEQGAGDALLVARDDRGRACTLLHRVAVIPAGALVPFTTAILNVYMTCRRSTGALVRGHSTGCQRKQPLPKSLPIPERNQANELFMG